MPAATRTALYPGTFDPVTLGHVDVVRRATHLFDRVVLAIAPSESKRPWFTLEERLAMAREALADLPSVEVAPLRGLTAEFARQRGAAAIIRGLRKFSDFEFEFQLALMNRRLNENVETVFLMPKDSYSFLSSRLVKEVARLKGDVSPFVAPEVVKALRDKLGT